MNIVRYRPFGELDTIQNEMNRLFASFTPDAFGREEAARGAWNPKVNIFENKDGLVLEAELPGVNQEDFDLTVEDNVITLKGERKFEKETSDDNYHRVERSYGSFSRSFTLPASVTADGSEASFSNGVLRVTLPKREETKARKIEIKGTDTPKTIETSSETKTANA